MTIDYLRLVLPRPKNIWIDNFRRNLYYERKIIQSVGRLFRSWFADSEKNVRIFPQDVPQDP